MRITSIALAAIASAMLANGAYAATYIVDPLNVPGASVTGTITTDGTLGALGYSNFTGLDLTVSDGNNSGHLDLSNLLNLAAYGSATVLIATNAGLFFDFSSNDAQGFAAFNFGSTGYCFTAGGITCFGTDHSESLQAGGAYYEGPRLSGLVRIAHVDAVPEPASWALMLGGFGLVGGALRSRRKAAVSFG